MTKPNLRYLYRVVYNDGSIYDQNLNDISISDPNKSCYNDIKLKEIRYFTLSDGINSYTLSLSDGGVSINGSPKLYLTHDKLTDHELVYYRRVTLDITDDIRTMTMNFVLGYTATNANGEILTHNIIIK